MKRELLVTCEHGGQCVPARFSELLRGAGGVLDTHRGWDPGALQLARELARKFDAPLLACTTTRLLVDTNRSLGHRSLFSEWSRTLSREEREWVLARWWRPHREATLAFVRAHRPTLHLSVHSFTPVWEGRERTVDIGFLYDPQRRRERELVSSWQEALTELRPELRLRRNQPYRGTADGLISGMRRQFGETRYVGVEVEISQRFPLGPGAYWRRLRADLCTSLAAALASGTPRSR